MRTKLVRVGNSRGVRIPQVLIRESGLEEEVDISVEDGAVVVRSVSNARASWVAAFERLGGEDGTLFLNDDGIRNDFDEEEWTWP